MPKRTKAPRGEQSLTTISVRFPDDLLETLRAMAQSEDRSLNAQVIRMLREDVNRTQQQSKPSEQ